MDNLLPLIAIETSGELCSVSLMLNQNSFIELDYQQKHIHSKKLIGMIDSVLKTADFEIKDMRAIAVSTGPGSFTGLRIGFSAAKGIAFGSGIGIIPVPSFDAFSFQISSQILNETSFVIAVKASSDEVYVGKYKSTEKGIEIFANVELISKNELPDYCGNIDLVYGNAGKISANLNSYSVGKWAYLFGKDLLTFDHDYLEPEYFGNPFLKKKQETKDLS